MVGEALHSICAVSKETHIISKTNKDIVATKLVLNAQGELTRYTLIVLLFLDLAQPYCVVDSASPQRLEHVFKLFLVLKIHLFVDT